MQWRRYTNSALGGGTGTGQNMRVQVWGDQTIIFSHLSSHLNISSEEEFYAMTWFSNWAVDGDHISQLTGLFGG
uniref:Uncharacterized protein n=1 Tax=Aegilops tauschii subsp. strangulata TaxID=200361 RepID=A0A453MCU0_AEGTS